MTLRRLGWLACLVPSVLAADSIQQAFERLYNFDFTGAHAVLDRHLAGRPDDAMGHSVRAAVLLFYELDRLAVLENEFFENDRRIADERNKPKPDPGVRARFFQAVEGAQARANAVLAARPDDPDALYALCMSHGLLGDYTALIERRNLATLAIAKRSNSCAQRLLRAHPEVHDAWVTVGFTEYLAGSLPFFVRWFVRFEGVQGSKQVGIAIMQKASQSGRYLSPFAKILLSIAYLREKKLEESRRMLAEFNRDYPENQLVRRELARLTERLAGGFAGQK
jgi:hypothetical protein